MLNNVNGQAFLVHDQVDWIKFCEKVQKFEHAVLLEYDIPDCDWHLPVT